VITTANKATGSNKCIKLFVTGTAPFFNTGAFKVTVTMQASRTRARYKCVMAVTAYQTAILDSPNAIAIVYAIAQGTARHYSGLILA
jgi:hypothetical protein